jgi:tetratricopeptide (TPR) repeat protein
MENNLTVEETFALAVKNRQKNNLQVAENLYKEVLKINPDHFESIFDLGTLLAQTKRFDLAKPLLQKAIQIQPNYARAHNSLGITFSKLGENQKAISSYEKAIQINPNYAMAHNNLGITFLELGEKRKSKSSFEKAIKIQPNYAHAYWNLHSLANDIDEALTILKKLYEFDNKYIKAKLMISALKAFKGKFEDFDTLIRSSESNHPMTRSIKWVFSLPKIPKIFFNRWDFFDAIVAQTDKTRPFYEFGVWNGISFKHLIKTFKKGFGFDTFTGIPEDWHNEPSGTYSSFGSVPKIKGGEFIVGKFENTLPKFFSQKRPLASLINFDADLYSSTLCALNYSNKVIDEKSILIFDELITNKNWEKDEYKALNEFCDSLSISYDVIAVSFYSKQVAIKLKK